MRMKHNERLRCGDAGGRRIDLHPSPSNCDWADQIKRHRLFIPQRRPQLHRSRFLASPTRTGLQSQQGRDQAERDCFSPYLKIPKGEGVSMKSNGGDESTRKDVITGGSGSGAGGIPSPNPEWRFNQTLRNVQGLVPFSLSIPITIALGPLTKSRSWVPMLMADGIWYIFTLK